MRQDPHGFVLTEHCDSTFFSGLLGASGYQVDMTAAEVGPGQWLRRPTSYPECWGCGKSRSTISRDMLLGVYWWAWEHQDLGLLERMWDYGVRHFWRMGRGRYWGADTIMNPAMISTLAQMIYVLGGKNHWVARRLPTWWSVTQKPGQFYVNRLTAIHLILRREIYGQLGWQAQLTTWDLANTWKDNPLFQLAAGQKIRKPGGIPSGVHSPEEYPIEWEFVSYRTRHAG